MKNRAACAYSTGVTDQKRLKTGLLAGALALAAATGVLGAGAALAGTAYTRIANNGAELDDTVVALGSGPLDWACTRDNATGLVWEVKTADGGLRDKTKTYTLMLRSPILIGLVNEKN